MVFPSVIVTNWKGENEMKIIKNGETYSAVNDDGKVVAFIVKNCFGTHGHWRGWEHYVYCDEKNAFYTAECINNCFNPAEEIPCIFCNIKEFKEYYEKR